MGALYTELEGRELLNFARRCLESAYSSPPSVPTGLLFRQSRGVYVVLRKKGKVCGVAGFSIPSYSLGDAILRAVRSAVSSSSRYPPLLPEALFEATVTLYLLHEPATMPTHLAKSFSLGSDALLIKYLSYSGFLLPSLAVEENLDHIGFLQRLCQEAGLPLDFWQKGKAHLYRIQTQEFREHDAHVTSHFPSQ